jgi:hypothetical protein
MLFLSSKSNTVDNFNFVVSFTRVYQRSNFLTSQPVLWRVEHSIHNQLGLLQSLHHTNLVSTEHS